jgi:hypothetical protein
METTSLDVSCPKCGAERPAEIAQTVPRPPCPKCGAKGIAIQLGIAEELTASDELTVGMSPGDQSRGWSRRWSDIQDDLNRLTATQETQLSGKGILEARHQLFAFYVHAYHLKDALKAESGPLGLSEEAIEKAITAEPALALLADLANLDKHLNLDRPPRSGDVPQIGNATGLQGGSGEGGWRLRQPITHHGQESDGVKIAEDAVAAWERLLSSWGLL